MIKLRADQQLALNLFRWSLQPIDNEAGFREATNNLLRNDKFDSAYHLMLIFEALSSGPAPGQAWLRSGKTRLWAAVGPENVCRSSAAYSHETKRLTGGKQRFSLAIGTGIWVISSNIRFHKTQPSSLIH